VQKAEEAYIATYLTAATINRNEKKLNTDVDAVNKESLGVKLLGGAAGEDRQVLSVNLTGGVASKNIYNGAITSEKFASTAKAPQAETANKINIGTSAYTLSLSGNVLTLTEV
jgi:hypothetical protein